MPEKPVATHRRDLYNPSPFHLFSEGETVKVNQHSGFSKGSTGVVVFVEPRAKLMVDGQVWVLRNRASGPRPVFCI